MKSQPGIMAFIAKFRWMTGVLATINTDDPGISGINLRHEYEAAARAAGLTAAQARQAQRNALAIAFLDAGERDALAALKR